MRMRKDKFERNIYIELRLSEDGLDLKCKFQFLIPSLRAEKHVENILQKVTVITQCPTLAYVGKINVLKCYIQH